MAMPCIGLVSLQLGKQEKEKSMNKRWQRYFWGVVMLSVLLVIGSGCSKNEEQQPEGKDSIEKITDEAAEAAVKKIRTPQDKARATRNLGDDRLEAMDKALQKQ
jgi:hypothetical protein